MSFDPMLEAVNTCLSGIGEFPVDSIHEQSADVSMAINTIERVSRNLQASGWWFNKEENWKLSPNPATGYMTPPENATSVLQMRSDRYKQVTIRGGLIYNVDDHTYDLSPLVDANGTINFSFIIHLEYNDLPPVAQYAISTAARRLFAQDLEVDPSRWKFQSTDEEKAMAMLYKEDGRNAKRNYIRDSPAAQQLGSVMRTNRLSNFPKRF